MKSEKTSAQPHGEVVQGQPEGEHPPFALKKGVLAGGIALRKGNTKADETEQDAADPFDILGGKLSLQPLSQLDGEGGEYRGDGKQREKRSKGNSFTL